MLFRASTVVARLARDGLREALIDLRGLRREIRLLVIGAYVAVFWTLAATLVFELNEDRLSTVHFEYGTAVFVRVPTAVVVVAGLAFALGWALVLTGASDFSRRVFLPIVGLFAFQLWVLYDEAGRGNTLLSNLALLPPALLGVAHLATHGSSGWRDHPLREFGAWLLTLLLALGVAWSARDSDAALVRGLSDDFIWLWVLAIPFWILLGLDVADAVVKLTRQVMIRLRRGLSGRTWGIPTLAGVVLAGRPFLTLPLVLDPYDVLPEEVSSIALDFALSFPLIVGAIGLALAGRWTPRAAATFLGLGLALPLVCVAAMFAARGHDLSDLAGTALSTTGLIPPLWLFVLLVTYNVVTFGARHANVAGRLGQRDGRVLLYFGAVILVIGFSAFTLNVRDAAEGQARARFDQLVNDCFTIGVLYLGVPYVLWVAWRHRERLVGDDREVGLPRPGASSPESAVS